MIADAHHHLWNLEEISYPWLDAEPDPDSWVGDIEPIRRNYLLADYLVDVEGCAVVRSVHVEAASTPADAVDETRWLQALANQHGFPHGIVAAARLENPRVDEELDAQMRYPNLRGIRQMLDRGEGTALLGRPDWERGLARLPRHGLSFDLQVMPGQLAAAAELAQRHPDLVFVLNHCGMPLERTTDALVLWRNGIRRLAEQPNVHAKISGLGMFDHSWNVDSLRPYVEEMLDAFGVEHCMFGSNFPLDKLYSSYADLVRSMEELTEALSAAERRAFFHDNAVRVYRL